MIWSRVVTSARGDPFDAGPVESRLVISISLLVAFALRGLLIVLFFPFSALDKILNFRQATAQAAEAVPVRPVAVALILCGLTMEVLTSLSILTGIADRLGALILALYCVTTAVLWKPFWRKADFRLKGESHGREVFWDFLKNLAVAAGCLLIAFGTTAQSVRQFVEHPLLSTHPYHLSGE